MFVWPTFGYFFCQKALALQEQAGMDGDPGFGQWMGGGMKPPGSIFSYKKSGEYC